MTAGWKGCATHRPTFPLTAIQLRQLCHAVEGEVSAPAATNASLRNPALPLAAFSLDR